MGRRGGARGAAGCSLRVHLQSGRSQEVYVDPETFLVLRRDVGAWNSWMEDFTSELWFLEHQEHEGMTFPRLIERVDGTFATVWKVSRSRSIPSSRRRSFSPTPSDPGRCPGPAPEESEGRVGGQPGSESDLLGLPLLDLACLRPRQPAPASISSSAQVPSPGKPRPGGAFVFWPRRLRTFEELRKEVEAAIDAGKSRKSDK